jgi:hypothetical protein
VWSVLAGELQARRPRRRLDAPRSTFSMNMAATEHAVCEYVCICFGKIAQNVPLYDLSNGVGLLSPCILM